MKIEKIINLGILLILLVSCDSELDQAPISDISINNYYETQEDFETAISGAYSSLLIYPDNQFMLSEIRSDNIYGVTPSGGRTHEPINNFDRNIATNEYVSSEWDNAFQAIMRANTVLENLNNGVITDQETLKRMRGESKFLRAFFYFDLVRLYGKVPLLDKVYTPEETLRIGRSSVVDVYELIISDLQEAIELLPADYQNQSSMQGKATSWSAKALLGLVYLTRSGPTYGIEGPGISSGEYNEALNLFNDIIDNGPFGFADNYTSIFAYDNENNEEIIFDVQYISGGTDAGGAMPSLTVPDGFLRVNQAGFPNGEEYAKTVATDLINIYEENDLRDDSDIQFGFTDINGNFLPKPFFIKFINFDYAGQNRFDWGLNFPVMRYTDILMMKAEAILLGGSGSQAEVDDIVNMVRNRAGLENISDVNIDMLLEEKRKEFAGEGKRWHDLIRTGKVIEVMNNWIPEEDVENRMNLMDVNQIIYPVPSRQMTVKEGLYEQNPGYN